MKFRLRSEERRRLIFRKQKIPAQKMSGDQLVEKVYFKKTEQTL